MHVGLERDGARPAAAPQYDAPDEAVEGHMSAGCNRG